MFHGGIFGACACVYIKGREGIDLPHNPATRTPKPREGPPAVSMASTLTTICSPGGGVTSSSSAAAAEQDCRRQYAPSVWGDFFIAHQLCTPEELLSTQQKASAKKEEVRRILLAADAAAVTSGDDDLVARKLELVDALQRLGVDYHYKEEIDALLRAVHEDHHDHGASASSHDLYVTSLRFYLLRKHGYTVSSGKGRRLMLVIVISLGFLYSCICVFLLKFCLCNVHCNRKLFLEADFGPV